MWSFQDEKKAKKLKMKKNGNPVVSLRRFALTYVLLMGAFFIVIGLKPIQDLIDLNGLYTQGVVFVTSRALNLTGLQCSYQGSIISLSTIALDVKFGCNGLEAVMIYSVAVIAFPADWKKRVIGILAGFVVLQVINVLRITALAYTGLHFKSLFEYIHIYVAQGLMIAVSLGIFFLYLSYAQDRRNVAQVQSA